MSDNRIRWTMSLRKRDEKLLQYFSDVEDGDRSAECRKLMYLGLELLEMRANGNEPTPETTSKSQVKSFRPKKVEQDELDLLNERLDNLI